MQALQIFAGPRARAHLRERGLAAADVRVIRAAAGGPKGLVLNPLDRFIFGHWLAAAPQSVHLLGASIGASISAWRMASACLPEADAALAQLVDDYIAQDYPHAPGKAPTRGDVSATFGDKLQQCFGGRGAKVLGHPRFRLHVLTSRGRYLLRREGRVRTPLGYLGASAAGLVSRRTMGAWLERNAQMIEGLVPYPHFQRSVVPGWLDKGLEHRHAATERLSTVVLLAPNPAWINASLPNAKLPNRGDFKGYGDDLAGRQKAWRRAVAESQCLADEFAMLVQQPSIDARALV